MLHRDDVIDVLSKTSAAARADREVPYERRSEPSPLAVVASCTGVRALTIEILLPPLRLNLSRRHAQRSMDRRTSWHQFTRWRDETGTVVLVRRPNASSITSTLSREVITTSASKPTNEPEESLTRSPVRKYEITTSSSF